MGICKIDGCENPALEYFDYCRWEHACLDLGYKEAHYASMRSYVQTVEKEKREGKDPRAQRTLIEVGPFRAIKPIVPGGGITAGDYFNMANAIIRQINNFLLKLPDTDKDTVIKALGTVLDSVTDKD